MLVPATKVQELCKSTREKLDAPLRMVKFDEGTAQFAAAIKAELMSLHELGLIGSFDTTHCHIAIRIDSIDCDEA